MKIADPVDRAFGDFIREHRLSLNWGVYKASSKTGLHFTRIMSLEKGTSHRSVLPLECEAFAHGYGICPDTLKQIAAGER